MNGRARAKPVPMCCVRIGYQDFILPFADGMKLVELMQRAFPAKLHFTGQYDQYVVEGIQSRVEFVSIRPDQVVRPSDNPRIQEEP